MQEPGSLVTVRGGSSFFCDRIEENVAEIVADWKRLTDRPPWNTLSSEQWVDHLPPLLRSMLDAVVCTTGSHEARRRVIEAGVEHGRHRREQGLPLSILFDEHSELRNATWRLITRRARELTPEVITDVVRFDAAGTFATMASLRGYHRREIEAAHDWNAEISAMVADWERTSLLHPDYHP